MGFRAKSDGFSFENYGNEDRVVNLTEVEMRRLFGDEVCASQAKGRCFLTPAAREWMTELNDSMDGGHCEGLAVLSLLFYAKKASPLEFGAATVSALQLEGNAKLQREIAYWFSLQEVSPTAEAETTKLTPADVLDRLTAAFAPGRPPELFALAIYKPEFEEGHAITPYSVVDRGGGHFAIGVYDSGFPGEERFVEVDRTKNTWQYQADEDAEDRGGLYTGDAKTGTLELSPLLVRLQKPECPFCGDADDEPEPAGKPPRKMQVISRGQAHVTVTDEAGHVTGRQGAALVNQIIGAAITSLRGRNLRAADREPVYVLPMGARYQIDLDAADLAKAESAAVHLVGPGFNLGVEEIVLDPGQHDTLVISKDRSEFTYETKAHESPELTLGISTPGADYEFTVVSTGGIGGQKVTLQLDRAKGLLRLQIRDLGGAKSQYALQIERIDDEGSELFSHAGLELSGSDIVSLDYGSWQGEGHPITLQLDVGGKGANIQRLEVADDE